MEKIKRYDLEDVSASWYSHEELIQHTEGDWVKYEDLAALEARNAELEKECEELNERDKRLSWFAQEHKHGCGCEYDNAGDVCLVHFPAKKRLEARVEELEKELESLADFVKLYHPLGRVKAIGIMEAVAGAKEIIERGLY